MTLDAYFQKTELRPSSILAGEIRELSRDDPVSVDNNKRSHIQTADTKIYSFSGVIPFLSMRLSYRSV